MLQDSVSVAEVTECQRCIQITYSDKNKAFCRGGCNHSINNNREGMDYYCIMWSGECFAVFLEVTQKCLGPLF